VRRGELCVLVSVPVRPARVEKLRWLPLNFPAMRSPFLLCVPSNRSSRVDSPREMGSVCQRENFAHRAAAYFVILLTALRACRGRGGDDCDGQSSCPPRHSARQHVERAGTRCRARSASQNVPSPQTLGGLCSSTAAATERAAARLRSSASVLSLVEFVAQTFGRSRGLPAVAPSALTSLWVVR